MDTFNGRGLLDLNDEDILTQLDNSDIDDLLDDDDLDIDPTYEPDGYSAGEDEEPEAVEDDSALDADPGPGTSSSTNHQVRHTSKAKPHSWRKKACRTKDDPFKDYMLILKRRSSAQLSSSKNILLLSCLKLLPFVLTSTLNSKMAIS